MRKKDRRRLAKVMQDLGYVLVEDTLYWIDLDLQLHRASDAHIAQNVAGALKSKRTVTKELEAMGMTWYPDVDADYIEDRGNPDAS